ncbi:hypothetical protein GCM10009841_19570 [Microlunatus panaciterrae]
MGSKPTSTSCSTTTAADLPDARLIYTEGPAIAPSHRVRHTTTTLQIHHLDLEQPPVAVFRHLSQIASEIDANRL